jgi:wobble nucleotide-excising tRNase
MITKINKIKNLGLLFCNYTCTCELPEFKRFNLIYGWNGSGKTTLSGLFDVIGGSKSQASLEYEIEDDQSKKYKQGDAFAQKIRVFNQDYIKDNIKLFEGRANSIKILLGKENKALVEEIEADEILLNGDPKDADKIGKVVLLREAQKEKKRKESDRSQIFTAIASTIGAAIGGQALRTYRRPQAETDFSQLTAKSILSDQEFDRCSVAIKQNSLLRVDYVELPNIIEAEKAVITSDALQVVIREAKSVLKKTVESEIISRLSENSDISEWVEQGIQLHKKHDSTFCEYCLQKMPHERIEQLARYFNEEDNKLKNQINGLTALVQKISLSIKTVIAPDNANLYDEMRERYSASHNNFMILQNKLLDEMDLLSEEIKTKKAKTTESIELFHCPDMKAFIEEIAKLNEVIDEHNKKTSDFNSVRDNATERLKNHYLSGIFDDVKALDSAIANLNDQISKIENGDSSISGDLSIKDIKQRIAENRAKISSTHKACEEINEGLIKFLGHDELHFVPHKERVVGESGEEREIDGGYLIMRGETQAISLSEGEKTAIAFVYFTVHLGDAEFNVKNGIVIIDDPISSLDANLLFRVCSYIQTRLRSVGQLFLLTHNYDFFNQMKKWFINDLNSDNDCSKDLGEFFMLTNKYDTGQKCRIAILSRLDNLLRDYESEYHYLFKKLLSFEEDNPGDGHLTIKVLYDYPILARKLLECFLSYRVPKRGSFYTRLISLKDVNKEISGEDLNYVYAFVNSHSHLDSKNGLVQFDPTLSVSGPESIKTVLKIVQQADEGHYKLMLKAVK